MKTKTRNEMGMGKRALSGGASGRASAVKWKMGDKTFAIRSILVPVDFSEPSIRALKYAAVFAKQFKAKLILLNVVEPVGTPDFMASFPIVMENDRLAEISQGQLKKAPAKYGIPPAVVEKVLVRTGVPYYEIASAARTLKTDLIIIATHGNTGLKHFMLGSTTERVVRYAPCPVFIVKENQPEIVESI